MNIWQYSLSDSHWNLSDYCTTSNSGVIYYIKKHLKQQYLTESPFLVPPSGEYKIRDSYLINCCNIFQFCFVFHNILCTVRNVGNTVKNRLGLTCWTVVIYCNMNRDDMLGYFLLDIKYGWNTINTSLVSSSLVMAIVAHWRCYIYFRV